MESNLREWGRNMREWREKAEWTASAGTSRFFPQQKTPADRGKAEQGIMEAKSADTFKPEGWTPKFNVIETWNKAFPKAA